MCNAREWTQAQPQPVKGQRKESRLHMQCSIQTDTICNSDAAWDKESMEAGLGWVIRHAGTENRQRGALKKSNVGSPLMAETFALMEAINQAHKRGLKRVTFKADSQELITALNKEEFPKELYGLLNDIKESLNDFELVVFEHVNRKDNQLADSLTKFVLRAQPNS